MKDKTQVAKHFGELGEQLRIEIEGLRTEVIERIGNLKTWMLISLVGSLASLVSMAINVATLILGLKVH